MLLLMVADVQNFTSLSLVTAISIFVVLLFLRLEVVSVVYYRTRLCVSAVFAVVRCLSVRQVDVFNLNG